MRRGSAKAAEPSQDHGEKNTVTSPKKTSKFNKVMQILLNSSELFVDDEWIEGPAVNIPDRSLSQEHSCAVHLRGKKWFYLKIRHS